MSWAKEKVMDYEDSEVCISFNPLSTLILLSTTHNLLQMLERKHKITLSKTERKPFIWVWAYYILLLQSKWFKEFKEPQIFCTSFCKQRPYKDSKI
jgi:phosphatidylserine decarboxylase